MSAKFEILLALGIAILLWDVTFAIDLVRCVWIWR